MKSNIWTCGAPDSIEWHLTLSQDLRGQVYFTWYHGVMSDKEFSTAPLPYSIVERLTHLLVEDKPQRIKLWSKGNSTLMAIRRLDGCVFFEFEIAQRIPELQSLFAAEPVLDALKTFIYDASLLSLGYDRDTVESGPIFGL